MTNNILKSLSLLVFLFLGINSFANNDTLTQEDVKEHNEIVKSVAQETNDVEKALKDYLSSKGLITGLNNQGKNKGKGKYIVTHIATVTKEKNDKRFLEITFSFRARG